MLPTTFENIFHQSACILGEGALIERLRRDSPFELDPFIVNSGFVYEEPKRKAMESIYRQYLDAGARHDLPLLLSTPTWRASRQRIADAGLADRDVNGDNFRFLDDLRKSYKDYSRKVVIGGIMSCKGDAYDRNQTLEADEAYAFHAWQAQKLAEAGVDFLMARQREYMDNFWHSSDVRIEGGDTNIQLAMRWNLFQLLQASGRVEGAGIAAKGLTGQAYEGHYFWDAEIYVLPFLIYTAPRIARGVLKFRYKLLDKAREILLEPAIVKEVLMGNVGDLARHNGGI